MKNAQVTVEKNEVAAAAPAAAEKKAPRTRRAPQATKEKKASAVVATAKVIGVPFVITQAARPSAGRHLYAFTEAALTMLGMFAGKAVDRAVLTNVIGSTAVSYHLTKTMSFALTPAGIEINGAYGTDFFKQRAVEGKFDPKDVEAYTEIMTSGKPDNRLVKNAGFIKAAPAA